MMLQTIIFDVYKSIVLFLWSFFPSGESLNIKSLEKETKNPDTDIIKENGLFLKLFSNEGTNINIHPDLYCISLENNDKQDWTPVEKLWKSRILIQNTLQGNVIMYYDIYKMAFVYYSDMQISYKWLNYCAMKYVRIFYCRDFFLDELFFPATFKNPFNQNEIKKEEDAFEKKEDKKKKMNIDFKSEVFLKRKETPKKMEQKNERREKIVNNFRYLGKLGNYSFLQIPVQQKKSGANKNTRYIDFKMNVKKKMADLNETTIII